MKFYLKRDEMFSTNGIHPDEVFLGHTKNGTCYFYTTDIKIDNRDAVVGVLPRYFSVEVDLYKWLNKKGYDIKVREGVYVRSSLYVDLTDTDYVELCLTF